MGSNSGAFSLRSSYVLVLSTSLVSQDINSNTSVIAWSLGISGPTGSFRLNVDSTWNINIDGATASGAFSYDFRSTTSKALGSGYITIPHNADGTVSYTAAASANANSPLGTASTSYGEALPTIPRASYSSFAPSPMVANSPVTISTNRHSTAFTHTISYSFGSQSGTIATGVGDSQSWTPPLSLLTEIPNSMSGTGLLTTQTYSGSTLIGTTTTPFTLQVPTGVVPTIGSVTATEAVAAIATGVGKCVQGLSKLALAIVSPLGAYGSTITSYKLQVDAQTINAQTGTTGIIASAGTLTVIATVTDSRGQVGTATTTIVVLPYASPVINTNVLTVQRAFADGTLNEQGTYLKLGINASVSSLLNGTEKNAINYRISTRQYGMTAYTPQVTITPGGIVFTGTQLVGSSFDIAHSWDILLEVFDNFSTTAVARTVATAAIFQHWDASVGMGLGKYRENGMLDVLGAIYQNNGQPVIDTSMLASDAEAIAATSTTKPVTPHSLAATITSRGAQKGTVDPAWMTGLPSVTLASGTVLTNVHYGSYIPKPGDTVIVEQIGSTGYIVAADTSHLPVQIPIQPQNGWILYSDAPGSDIYQQFGDMLDGGGYYGGSAHAGYFYAGVTSTGIVKLSGLLRASLGFGPTSGSVIANLPAGMRPTRTQVFPGVGGDNGMAWLYITPNGDVHYGGGNNTFLSLDNITFRADGTATFVPLAFTNGSTAYAGSMGPGDTATAKTPGYTVDSEGIIVFEGVFAGGTLTATTNMQQITALGAGVPTSHFVVVGGGAFGFMRIGATAGTQGTGTYLNVGAANATWTSLGGIVTCVTPVGFSYFQPMFISTWVNYTAPGFTQYALAKTPSGLVLQRGLIATGPIGTSYGQVAKGWRPRHQIIQAAASNAAFARMDSNVEIAPFGRNSGQNQFTVGNATWASLDSSSWLATQ